MTGIGILPIRILHGMTNDVAVIDEVLEYACLTPENSGIDGSFNLRAVILMSKRLGRTLTDRGLASCKGSPTINCDKYATM